MDIEYLIDRFPHIAEQIFEYLDDKSLVKCREVVKSWQEFIDNRNLPWKRIVKIEKYFLDGNSFLHVAIQTGQSKKFKELIQGEKDKNPTNYDRFTPFYIACQKGLFVFTEFLIQNSEYFTNDFKWPIHLDHSKVAELFIQNSLKFNIDLNAKDSRGKTAFKSMLKFIELWIRISATFVIP